MNEYMISRLSHGLLYNSQLPSNPCDYYTNGKTAKVSHTQNDTVVVKLHTSVLSHAGFD